MMNEFKYFVLDYLVPTLIWIASIFVLVISILVGLWLIITVAWWLIFPGAVVLATEIAVARYIIERLRY